MISTIQSLTFDNLVHHVAEQLANSCNHLTRLSCKNHLLNFCNLFNFDPISKKSDIENLLSRYTVCVFEVKAIFWTQSPLKWSRNTYPLSTNWFLTKDLKTLLLFFWKTGNLPTCPVVKNLKTILYLHQPLMLEIFGQ